MLHVFYVNFRFTLLINSFQLNIQSCFFAIINFQWKVHEKCCVKGTTVRATGNIHGGDIDFATMGVFERV